VVAATNCFSKSLTLITFITLATPGNDNEALPAFFFDYLNNGSNWVESSNLAIPISITDGAGQQMGVRLCRTTYQQVHHR
jgi:hypothetical protein